MRACQFALSQLCVRVDDGLAPPGLFAALLEYGVGGLQCRGHRVDGRCGTRRIRDGAHEQVLQYARTPEQNLPLVGVVPEVGAMSPAKRAREAAFYAGYVAGRRDEAEHLSETLARLRTALQRERVITENLRLVVEELARRDDRARS